MLKVSLHKHVQTPGRHRGRTLNQMHVWCLLTSLVCIDRAGDNFDNRPILKRGQTCLERNKDFELEMRKFCMHFTSQNQKTLIAKSSTTLEFGLIMQCRLKTYSTTAHNTNECMSNQLVQLNNTLLGDRANMYLCMYKWWLSATTEQLQQKPEGIGFPTKTATTRTSLAK